MPGQVGELKGEIDAAGRAVAVRVHPDHQARCCALRRASLCGRCRRRCCAGQRGPHGFGLLIEVRHLLRGRATLLRPRIAQREADAAPVPVLPVCLGYPRSLANSNRTRALSKRVILIQIRHNFALSHYRYAPCPDPSQVPAHSVDAYFFQRVTRRPGLHQRKHRRPSQASPGARQGRGLPAAARARTAAFGLPDDAAGHL